ncbi:MAG: hypothetical protein PPP56_06235 [Longimonas sp.]|uniref:hypothetical protein n=1 Tax=Longimonas sp. TaxID=2039626 RepID=UPI003348F0C5
MPLTEWIWTDLLIVGGAGAITGLATGLGVLPFFVTRRVSARWVVGLWGATLGLLATMSVLVLYEGVQSGPASWVLGGAVLGMGLMAGTDQILRKHPPTSSTSKTHQQRLTILVNESAQRWNSLGLLHPPAFAVRPHTTYVEEAYRLP